MVYHTFMKELQQKIDQLLHDIAPGVEHPYWQPHEILATMTEEVGELAREINAIYGPKKKKATEAEVDLGHEIADVVVQAVILANALDVDLGQALKEKIEIF
jgi:NTP pyrophosphatase (non-canonical NTP hydrolase)